MNRSWLPALAATAGLGLVACSGSSSPSTTAAPTAQPSVASAAPTASAGDASAIPSQSPVAAESNPPGDIPDNLAFVPYANTAGGYSFKHPEGWAQTESGTTVTFTDKLNGVHAEPGTATSSPTVASARRDDVPQLSRSQPAFELRSVTAVTMPGGTGVRIVYRRNSQPDAVTGRQYRDEVERYELVSHGKEIVLELYGPLGADNVDAYRTMVQSLRIT
ncbi:MAG: hypothetical protein QOE99_129 [Actinomycetota bacterium]|jgi:hypothetical protein|nr:hypothetical protein [Actinomycetota bacterium]